MVNVALCEESRGSRSMEADFTVSQKRERTNWKVGPLLIQKCLFTAKESREVKLKRFLWKCLLGNETTFSTASFWVVLWKRAIISIAVHAAHSVEAVTLLTWAVLAEPSHLPWLFSSHPTLSPPAFPTPLSHPPTCCTASTVPSAMRLLQKTQEKRTLCKVSMHWTHKLI